MSLLIAGLVIFLGVHSISIVSPSWRDQMAASMGEWPWKGIYSVASLVGVVMISRGYGQARLDAVFLYFPPQWLQHAAMLMLLLVFPLVFAAYFPGRIKSAVKHPMLLAIQIWALGHLLANGRLADVVLFGSFLLWAGADRISMNYREQRTIPSAPPSKSNDLIAVVGGLAVYGIFVIWLHQWLIGVKPYAS